MSTGPRPRADVVPLREATKAWFLISLQTFGGPAGQIAVMQHELVDKRRWIGQQRFLHALNYCTLLPGPEAQQLAIYTGWLLNGTRGGLIAGSLFVFPGVIALLVLSAIYVQFGSTGIVSALFAGVAPAVIAIVVQAVHRIGTRALDHPALIAIAVGAFMALTLFAVPFPLVVIGAGVIGWALGRVIPALARGSGHGDPSDGPAPLISDAALHYELPSKRRSIGIVVIGACCCGSRRSPSSPPSCRRPTCSSTKGCSSQARRSSRSEAPTPSFRTSPNRRSTSTAGSARARW